MYITYSSHSFFFFRNEKVKVWGSQVGGNWICLGGEGEGGCLDELFWKILPEAKSVFIPIYNCFFFCFFPPQKQRWREMCKSSMFSLERKYWKEMLFKTECLCLYLYIYGSVWLSTFRIPKACLPFLYTSAFWLFSSSVFSSSEDPFSFSPVFQLPCLFQIKDVNTTRW